VKGVKGGLLLFLQEAMVLGELRGPGRAERLRYRRFVEHYAAVAQRIRRTKATSNPIAGRRLITAMLNV